MHVQGQAMVAQGASPSVNQPGQEAQIQQATHSQTASGGLAIQTANPQQPGQAPWARGNPNPQQPLAGNPIAHGAPSSLRPHQPVGGGSQASPGGPQPGVGASGQPGGAVGPPGSAQGGLAQTANQPPGLMGTQNSGQTGTPLQAPTPARPVRDSSKPPFHPPDLFTTFAHFSISCLMQWRIY